jgi:hypothetical protein
MKTLVATLLTLTLSSTVNATPANVKFVAKDQKSATKLCLVAAQSGLHAAEQLAATLDLNDKGYKLSTKCNGESLLRFARKFEQAESSPAMNKVYKLITANQLVESEICTQAVAIGVQAATTQFGNIKDILCNGKHLTRFVKKYQTQSL